MKPLFRTRNRGRTGTGITAHRILSPACLPIPPSEQPIFLKDGANLALLFNYPKSFSILRHYALISNTTAVAEAPSSRPSKPRRSVVVALTETLSAEMPRTSANRSRIVSI